MNPHTGRLFRPQKRKMWRRNRYWVIRRSKFSSRVKLRHRQWRTCRWRHLIRAPDSSSETCSTNHHQRADQKSRPSRTIPGQSKRKMSQIFKQLLPNSIHCSNQISTDCWISTATDWIRLIQQWQHRRPICSGLGTAIHWHLPIQDSSTKTWSHIRHCRPFHPEELHSPDHTIRNQSRSVTYISPVCFSGNNSSI